MEFFLLISFILILAVIIGLIYSALNLRRQARRLSAAEMQIHSLSENLNALCAGAVGVDQRVSNLERTGRDLAYRQESMESHQQDRPYGEAIQLVQQGADANRLVQQLGLSRSEAELVVMLHGTK